MFRDHSPWVPEGAAYYHSNFTPAVADQLVSEIFASPASVQPSCNLTPRSTNPNPAPDSQPPPIVR